MVPAGREKLAHKHENTCLSILNWGSRKNVYFSVRLPMGGGEVSHIGPGRKQM